jgi:integrase/recombinase XerD
MTKTHDPDNERIKRRYLTFLREAKGQSVASIDAVAKALARFEADTKYSDFKRFRSEQAAAFKRHLAEQLGQRSGEPLSKATLYSTVNALRSFFQWLSGQPGYKRHFTYSDADYFTLLAKDVRIATAHRESEGPTLEQIARVVDSMPSDSEIERRDRAVIAFTILTGARDSAIASLKLKHIDLANNLVEQDARQVRTKASKTFTTCFFPVGHIYRQVVADWVEYLRKEELWGLNDPLFPRTRVEPNANREFAAVGLEREHWSSAAPIRGIFATAFTHAGLPYYHPHSFRKTLVRLGETICRTPEEFKAWSQNLGHEHVLTTFTSYGTVSRHRQAEIMSDLRNPQASTEAEDDRLRQIAEDVYRAQGKAR